MDKRLHINNVSKEIFLNTLVCPTLGWLMRMKKEEVSKKPTEGKKFRIEEGIEIGRRTRELFPDGVLIEDKDTISASEKTRRLMNDPVNSVIFEGTFLVDEFIARADILKRKKDGWHLIEVKSSVNDKKDFIDDMAYTAMVIEQAGFNLSSISLLLLAREFRLGMENKDLFIEIEHTNEVLERVEDFKNWWKQVEKITKQAEKPESKLQWECHKCELFKECVGKNIENHIFDIPHLSKSQFNLLNEKGITSIEEIPDNFQLTEWQTIVKNCVKTKEQFVNKASLKRELESISWPAYYLDFETVKTAIPLYPNIAPHSQIPTQYSIHKCSDPGWVIDHFEYLFTDPGKDCRRELAENLLNDLKGEGSIIVYSSFEKTIILSLSELFPGLSEDLNSLISRLVDLEKIIKGNFYHPGLHGKTSIKNVLPVLVPDMSYKDLEIQDGDTAMATFANLARGKYKGGEAETKKRNLLEYCKRDTYAMVKVHEKLYNIVAQ